jgi:hypothetical protein
MMEYASWTHRASLFLRKLTHLPGEIAISDGIAAAGDDDHTKDWLQSAKCSLPPELRDFIATASRGCYFSYRWKPNGGLPALLAGIYPNRSEITGGADLCAASNFQCYDNRDFFARLGRMGLFARADDPERTHGRIAILAMNNGDQISVISKDAEPGGKIVYVPKESLEQPQFISDSFGEFLASWEQIAYITPSWENLAPWLDPKTGLLKPDSTKAERLRQVLVASSAEERSIA